MSTDETSVSWSHTAEESRLLRALVSFPLGVLAGGILAVLLGLVAVVGLVFVNGNYVVGAALLFAFGVGLARFAPHHVARVKGERSLASEFEGASKWWVAGSAVVGIGALALGAQFGRGGLLATVLGTVVAPLLAAAVLTSEGELDAATGTLTYGGTDVDLRTLDGFRQVSLGGYVVYRLSYVSGAATFTTPRSVVVPKRVDAALRSGFESGVSADAPEGNSPKRAVRVAAIGMGVFFLGFAGVLLTVEPTTTHPRGQGVLWYAALVSGGFGALMVSVGLRGG